MLVYLASGLHCLLINGASAPLIRLRTVVQLVLSGTYRLTSFEIALCKLQSLNLPLFAASKKGKSLNNQLIILS